MELQHSSNLVFYVNGNRISIRNPSHSQTLLDYIRNDLGLTGTKLSCGESGCGSCTVTCTFPDFCPIETGSCQDARTNRISNELNSHNGPIKDNKICHHAINACTTKIISLHGMSITTIEGLGCISKGLHPVQEKIHIGHGSQCGYCTPGMVMSLSSELRNKLEEDQNDGILDVEDMEKCLQGNLCRCTGYRPILESFDNFCKGSDNARLNTKQAQQDNPNVPEEVLSKKLSQEYLHFIDNEDNHWFRPTSLTQLLNLQKSLKSFQIIQGGTGSYAISKSTSNQNNIQLGSSILELNVINETDSSIEIGSCVKLTEIEKYFKKMISNSDELSPVYQLGNVFSKALSSLASAQVRNVASVGGSVLWNHPSSDLMTIYILLGCKLRVHSPDGDIKEITIDESFHKSKSDEIINNGSIILTMKIPKPPSQSMIGFYKKSKRKEFALSIINLGIILKYDGSKGGNFDDVKIVIGGTENPGKIQTPAYHIIGTNVMKEISGVVEVSIPRVIEAISKDLPIHLENQKMGIYRQGVAVSFLKQFLGTVAMSKTTKLEVEKAKISTRTSTQTYQKIKADQPSYDEVEKPIAHVCSAEQASGSALYVDDIPMQGRNELCAVLIFSERANARIKSIDFSALDKIEGIVGHISAQDLSIDQNLFGGMAQDEKVFASERVDHHGQVLAALLCTSFELGRNAQQFVKVTYDDCEANSPSTLCGLGDLIEIDGIDAFEKVENFGGPQKLKRYLDVDLNHDSTNVVEGTVSIGGQQHFYMEPQNVLVVPIGEKDEYVVYGGGQWPDGAQGKLSKALNIAKNKITIKTKRTGGAFGGKERCHTTLIAGLAAQKFGKPVRLTLTTSEDMLFAGAKHEVVVNYKVTFDTNGKIVTAIFKAFANSGCSLDNSVVWTQVLINRIDGGYTLRNIDATGYALKTNLPSNTAFRGYGAPEGAIVIETVMDHIAHVLKLDPLEVRSINMTKDGDKVHCGNKLIEGSTLLDCWEECLKTSEYHKKRALIEEFNKNNRETSKKRGISMIPMKFACSFGVKFLQQSTVLVHIYTDGSVLISHGGIEMGQGLNTKLIQVASRALQVPSSKIHIQQTSTEVIANASPTGGSTGTDINGSAVLDACNTLLKRLAPYRSSMTWEQSVTAAYFDQVELSVLGRYTSPNIQYDFTTNEGNMYDYLTYGAGCTQVEVDCITGEVTVISADIVMDVGRSINPAIDVGQIEGAFMQGLGYVTIEQMLRSRHTGELLSVGPGNYKIPTFKDVPKSFNVTLLKDDGTTKPCSTVYSSKGIGEPGMIMCANILSAIRQAVFAHRKIQDKNEDWFHIDPPATPQKIFFASNDYIAKEVIAKNKDANDIREAIIQT